MNSVLRQKCCSRLSNCVMQATSRNFSFSALRQQPTPNLAFAKYSIYTNPPVSLKQWKPYIGVLTAGQATTLVEAPLSRTLAPLESSRAVERVAELARAWAQIGARLPTHAQADVYSQLVISALKLVISLLEHAPARADGRAPWARAVQLAALLADLCAAGLPLDAPAIAASVLLEAADTGLLDNNTIKVKLGPEVASLVHDCLRVRTAPRRMEMPGSLSSTSLREWCIAFHDIRANVVVVVERWDELRAASGLPEHQRQVLALEALQVYAPLGHALGLGAVSSAMEDLAFQALFSEPYTQTREWLHGMVGTAEGALHRAQAQLLAALATHTRFNTLAAGCMLRARTKSLLSIMKKLLRVGAAAGSGQHGRRKAEVYDLLGLRLVVMPRTDVPADEAEMLAAEACYVVQQVAQQLWDVVPNRTKDYIAHPKANGYRCIHLTIRTPSVICSPAVLQQADARDALTSTGPASELASVTSSGEDGCETHWPLRTTPASSWAWGSSLHAPLPQASCSSLSSVAAAAGNAAKGVQHCTQQGAPFMELQIRTNAMDERAESGPAAHAHYKGGLMAQQVQQLHVWTQQLQLQLAGRPHNKLPLPPSLAFRGNDNGVFGMLDSIDVDVELGSSSSTTSLCSDSSIDDGFMPALPGSFEAAHPAAVDQSGSASPAPAPKPRQTATDVLFSFLDRNGDGCLSVDELREQLCELTAGGYQLSKSSSWLTPLGALSAGVASMSTPDGLPPPAGCAGSSYECKSQHGMGIGDAGSAAGDVAGAQGSGASADVGEIQALVSLMTGQSGQVTLTDFKAFIKQAAKLQSQKRKNACRLQQLQRLAENEAWGPSTPAASVN